MRPEVVNQRPLKDTRKYSTLCGTCGQTEEPAP